MINSVTKTNVFVKYILIVYLKGTKKEPILLIGS